MRLGMKTIRVLNSYSSLRLEQTVRPQPFTLNPYCRFTVSARASQQALCRLCGGIHRDHAAAGRLQGLGASSQAAKLCMPGRGLDTAWG